MLYLDLHSGNILIRQNNEATIADLEISKPVKELSDKNSIYGVIPYVTPEVLKGENLHKLQTFVVLHDEHLILDILNGHCPKIPNDTPQELVELMERCWHPEKENLRPQIEKNINSKYLNG
ncbi:33673_t:CDS:2 [Gigaspora margarita]|uniref:33673_t:CDS:1 n=1 Tax=Gigaspora margarita TaxID=4874 RepID=A0ABN7UH25_GIGMA|nr:33673_t:CDS:2 [Gigaspora margarita]